MDIFVHPTSASLNTQKKERYRRYETRILNTLEKSTDAILLIDNESDGNKIYREVIPPDHCFQTQRRYTNTSIHSTGKIAIDDSDSFAKLIEGKSLRFHGLDAYYCVADAMLSCLYPEHIGSVFRVPLKARLDALTGKLGSEKYKYGVVFTDLGAAGVYFSVPYANKKLLKLASDSRTCLFS